MHDVNMSEPLPAIQLDEYGTGQPGLVFDPEHGGYDEEWHRMTLAHLVQVLKALTPEQRSAVLNDEELFSIEHEDG